MHHQKAISELSELRTQILNLVLRGPVVSMSLRLLLAWSQHFTRCSCCEGTADYAIQILNMIRSCSTIAFHRKYHFWLRSMIEACWFAQLSATCTAIAVLGSLTLFQ
eukprot:3469030-Amphidinium_carterae.1